MTNSIDRLNSDLKSDPKMLDAILASGIDVDSMVDGANSMGYDITQDQLVEYYNRTAQDDREDDVELAGMMWCTNTTTRTIPAHPPSANQSLGTAWAVADVFLFTEVAVAVVAVAVTGA